MEKFFRYLEISSFKKKRITSKTTSDIYIDDNKKKAPIIFDEMYINKTK